MDNQSLTQIAQAVEVIKTAILQSQERTIKNANTDVLALNYAVGGFISLQSTQQQWGSGIIRTISEKLQRDMPGLRGFGYENLKKMRQFYETWFPYIMESPSATQLRASENRSPSATRLPLLKTKSLSNTFDVETAHDFLSISFTHHMEIINKTDSIEERLFYIKQAAKYKWDKYRLRDLLKQDLYHHQSEELGVRDEAEVDEKVVENTKKKKKKNFIMTFGRDFTFVGNQYHMEKFGENHFIDLLFYNRELTCLVAVELKLGKFKPIYLAQLQTYLQVLDDDVRKPNENPSIGIILCQDVNKSYVEYVIQRYDSPMGVATYKTAADMPENLRRALPDMEDLKRLISEK